MEVDKGLWQAARGVGVIVAHKGSTDVAQALLNKVKKYVGSVAAKIAIHLDLGHLSMDRALDQKGGLPQKPQLQQAIGFYRVAHRQAPNSAEIALYYASALFHGAVAFNDVTLFKNCQMVLNNAMLIDPANTRIRFNTATCLMRMAYHFLRDQQKMQIEDHVNQAVGMLRSAHRIFEYLQDGKQARQNEVQYYIPKKMGDTQKLHENAEYCKKAVLQCENFLTKLAETRISRDRKNEEQKRQKDAEVKRLEAEKARIREEELEKQKDADATAEDLMDEAVNWKLREQADAADQVLEEEKELRRRRRQKHDDNVVGDQDDYLDKDFAADQDFEGATLEELGLASSDEEGGDVSAKAPAQAAAAPAQDDDFDFLEPSGESSSQPEQGTKRRLRKGDGEQIGDEQQVVDDDFDMGGGDGGDGDAAGAGGRKKQRIEEDDDDEF